MTNSSSTNSQPDHQSPLRVLFVITSMPVGGAETLLVNLVRRLDRGRFAPEICCLKEPGPLGELMAAELPVHSHLLCCKWDLRILARLTGLMLRRRIDAVVTVGAGDKMFWGRLAARLARVPVVVSALHSTGWPDAIGRCNRLLTPLTDAFIGVAQRHHRYLVEVEDLPESKVRLIRNGVDTARFAPNQDERIRTRRLLGIDEGAPVCGIVAALRPEKNHALFLQAAALVRQRIPHAQFLVVGDGPLRAQLEHQAATLGLQGHVHFLGSRDDIPALLRALDLFVLTSHNEANPVSILEAMASGLPVVATCVGSVPETVQPDLTGYLAEPGDARQVADFCVRVLGEPSLAVRLGRGGRQAAQTLWSLDQMVQGYEDLLSEFWSGKASPAAPHGAIRCPLS